MPIVPHPSTKCRVKALNDRIYIFPIAVWTKLNTGNCREDITTVCNALFISVDVTFYHDKILSYVSKLSLDLNSVKQFAFIRRSSVKNPKVY